MIMNYLKKKGYEVVKASEEGKHLAYVPYSDHLKVSKYLKQKQIPFKIRYTFDYSLAVYHI
jgi:hypothetical protein